MAYLKCAQWKHVIIAKAPMCRKKVHKTAMEMLFITFTGHNAYVKSYMIII